MSKRSEDIKRKLAPNNPFRLPREAAAGKLDAMLLRHGIRFSGVSRLMARNGNVEVRLSDDKKVMVDRDLESMTIH